MGIIVILYNSLRDLLWFFNGNKNFIKTSPRKILPENNQEWLRGLGFFNNFLFLGFYRYF